MEKILEILKALGYAPKLIKKQEEEYLNEFTEVQLEAIEKLAAIERVKGSIDEAERILPYDRAYALDRIMTLEKQLEKLEKKFHMPVEKKESPRIMEVRIVRG